jgi:hypothetical protein
MPISHRVRQQHPLLFTEAILHGDRVTGACPSPTVPDLSPGAKQPRNQRLIDGAEAPERSVDHATGIPPLPSSGPR